jgi:glycosyltransferase involved in cell wall biosynthesis
MTAKLSLSIVVPFLDEELSLPILRRRLEGLAGLPEDRELILVSDGSTDGSAAFVERWAAEDSRVKLIELARNFGHQPAIRAGLDAASGGCVAVMDADLQDPPEELLRMYGELKRDGLDVVYGVRAAREGGFALRLAYRAFYALFRALSDGPSSPDSGDFCVLSRRAVDILRRFPERVQYLRGLRAWIGLRSRGLPMNRPLREAGDSRYSLGKLVSLAVNGIVAFSAKPLRLASLLGAVLCATAMALAAVYLVLWLAYDIHSKSPGFTTIVILLLFLSGAQLLMMGILGEYIRQIFLEVKGRPVYLVARTVNLPD